VALKKAYVFAVTMQKHKKDSRHRRAALEKAYVFGGFLKPPKT